MTPAPLRDDPLETDDTIPCYDTTNHDTTDLKLMQEKKTRETDARHHHIVPVREQLRLPVHSSSLCTTSRTQ